MASPQRRAPGEGSLVQRPDGRWQASLQVEGRRRTVYGKTRAEAVGKLDALKRQALATDCLASPGRRTVSELLDAWLSAVGPNLRPTTAAHYALLADTYVRPVLGMVRLAKFTPQRIQVHLATLQDRPRVAQLAFFVLNQACALAVRWHWLGTNPCARVVRPQYHAPARAVWDTGQLQTFLAGACAHWQFPLWYTLLASGCRLGELLGLAWPQVNLDAGTVTIRYTLQRVGAEYVRGEPKTHAGQRVVQLPSQAVTVLATHQAHQGNSGPNTLDLVFPAPTGAPLHRAVVAHALRRECARLGLPPLTPHGLRHLHASLLLAEGLPLPEVARRLGHAHTGITATVYSHAIRGDTAAAEAIEHALMR